MVAAPIAARLSGLEGLSVHRGLRTVTQAAMDG